MESAFHVEVLDHPGYVHAVGTGPRTAENMLRFLKEAHAACVEREKSSLLVEVRFTGPSLDMASIFAVVDGRSVEARKLARMAYVDRTSPNPGRSTFAETVAVNRGVNVKLFADVESAQRWLAGA